MTLASELGRSGITPPRSRAPLDTLGEALNRILLRSEFRLSKRGIKAGLEGVRENPALFPGAPTDDSLSDWADANNPWGGSGSGDEGRSIDGRHPTNIFFEAGGKTRLLLLEPNAQSRAVPRPVKTEAAPDYAYTLMSLLPGATATTSIGDLSRRMAGIVSFQIQTPSETWGDRTIRGLVDAVELHLRQWTKPLRSVPAYGNLLLRPPNYLFGSGVDDAGFVQTNLTFNFQLDYTL